MGRQEPCLATPWEARRLDRLSAKTLKFVYQRERQTARWDSVAGILYRRRRYNLTGCTNEYPYDKRTIGRDRMAKAEVQIVSFLSRAVSKALKKITVWFCPCG